MRREPFGPTPAVWPCGWTIEVASTRRERGKGLLGRDALDDRSGLWLPVRSVHTLGMRFALDLAWLNRDGTVVRLEEQVDRGRIRTCLAARGGVVELAAGAGPSFVAALRCDEGRREIRP